MRYVVVYALLVGLPLLALVGVIRYGRDLTPPPSVAGKWRVELEGEAEGVHGALLAAEHRGFRIAQSGSRLEVRVRGRAESPAKGILEDGRLHAEQEGAWRIEALLVNDVLAGSWSVIGTSTSTLRFTAFREEGPRRKGGGH